MCKTVIPGGQQPPNLTIFAESEQDAVLQAYKKARKRYTDVECQKCLKDTRLTKKGYVGVSGD